MTNTWLVADPHFGHEGTATKFKRHDDTPLRPFRSVWEQDETMISKWNERVAPGDRVYVLGDLCMQKRNLPTIGRCNGRKVLIKGNHDILPLKAYLPFFDDVRAFHKLDHMEGETRLQFVLTHIPIHPDSLERWTCNIHGHLHYRRQMMPHPYVKGQKVIDPKYLCVSVEHTDYAPITFNECVKRWKAQQ